MKKKTWNKGIACALAAVLLLGTVALGVSIASPAAETDANTLRLWYDEPASQTASVADSNGVWQSATLPIGNGRLGANVYGELSKEHLTLNEETLWSGGRGSVTNYDGGNIDNMSNNASYWSNIVTQVKNGSSFFNKETLKGDTKSASGYVDGYQALGDLYFDFGHSSGSDYSRELNLNTGVSTVSYTCNGVQYTRTYFVSNDPNVIVAHFAADGGTLSFTTSMTSKQSGTLSASVNGSIGYITCAGTVSNNGLLHNTQVAVVPTDGSVSVSGTGIQVSGATAVTVYLTAATDYATTFSSGTTDYYYRTGETAEQLSARVKNELTEAVDSRYDIIYNDYETYYTGLFDRVTVDLGGESSKTTNELLSAYQGKTATAQEQRYLETLQYQYGRYLLIAGSSEDSQLPTTLQGIWNNNNTAPWYSDIHTNINLEMNYWLAGTGNLTECLEPLVNYMNAMYEPGNRTVQCYTDATVGMMMHTQNTPFGYTSPGWEIGTWGWSPSASTWLLQNCYDYYEYSKNTDSLQSSIFPLMAKQVAMYEQLLENEGTSENPVYVFPVAYSPEHGNITFGNTYEQSLIWQLYQDTIEAAETLGYADDAEIVSGVTLGQAKYTFAHLKGLELGTNDSSQYIKEWYNETYYGQFGETGHRHISQMLGIYPGNMNTSEEINAAAINTLNLRGMNTVSGWSLAQRACTWAALGQGDNAYTYLSTVLTSGVMQNLWGYHAYSSYGGDNKAFQIDANYGYSAAFNEMLLQSNYGYIDPLPALPSAWASGSVSGLLAEGNFTVDMTWADSKLTDMTVTSNAGGNCSVKLDADMLVRDASGNVVASSTEDGTVVTFATTADESYTIESTTLKVSVSRNYDGSVALTWNAQSGVTYTVNNGSADLGSNLSDGAYTDTEAAETAVTYTVTGSDGSVAVVTAGPVILETAAATSFERVNSSNVTDGIYLIVGARPGYSAGKAAESDRSLDDISAYISGTSVSAFDGVESYEWEIKAVSGGYTIQSVSSGSYLQMSNNNVTTASVSSSAVTLQINDASAHFSDAVYIYNSASQAYLNYRQDGGGTAGTWTDSDVGSSWYLYKLTSTAASYTINGDVLASAAAAGDSSNTAFASALAAAQESFNSYDAAYAAYQALVNAINADTPANLNLNATRNADGSVTLTWNAEDGVTYTIYRKANN